MVTDQSTSVLHLRIDPMTMGDALTALDKMLVTRRSDAVHFCNAWNAVLAERDQDYAGTLNAGTLNLADGKSMVWSARLLGTHREQERVTGTAFMVAACERRTSFHTRHFLYGGEPGVATDLADRLRSQCPGIEIVGAESPPYRQLAPAEEDELAERLARSGADLVWVGLGTPKQDLFIERFRRRVDVGALLAVGAAFDFLAGRKAAAPSWMQRAGLEWAFRLVSEPRRLWRRYLIGNSVFLARFGMQLTRKFLHPPRRA
ncbi:MAG: WecB/TagA/CpsF family glycosyltransferase [Frankia sp.]